MDPDVASFPPIGPALVADAAPLAWSLHARRRGWALATAMASRGLGFDLGRR